MMHGKSYERQQEFLDKCHAKALITARTHETLSAMVSRWQARDEELFVEVAKEAVDEREG